MSRFFPIQMHTKTRRVFLSHSFYTVRLCPSMQSMGLQQSGHLNRNNSVPPISSVCYWRPLSAAPRHHCIFPNTAKAQIPPSSSTNKGLNTLVTKCGCAVSYVRSTLEAQNITPVFSLPNLSASFHAVCGFRLTLLHPPLHLHLLPGDT